MVALAVSAALAARGAQAQSGITDLGTLGGSSVHAYNVSADGSVVVGYAYLAGDATYRAFRCVSLSFASTIQGDLLNETKNQSSVHAHGDVADYL